MYWAIWERKGQNRSKNCQGLLCTSNFLYRAIEIRGYGWKGGQLPPLLTLTELGISSNYCVIRLALSDFLTLPWPCCIIDIQKIESNVGLNTVVSCHFSRSEFYHAFYMQLNKYVYLYIKSLGANKCKYAKSATQFWDCLQLLPSNFTLQEKEKNVSLSPLHSTLSRNYFSK